MNFKEPLVNFLKIILNNINSAFSLRIDQLQLQALREINILKVMNRGIEKLFGQEPRDEVPPRVMGGANEQVCTVERYVECREYELLELKAKEIQMNYEKMVFEMTQELKGDKRVLSLITHFTQSHDLEGGDIETVKKVRGRRFCEDKIQVIPIRFMPICLKKRAQMMKRKKIND